MINQNVQSHTVKSASAAPIKNETIMPAGRNDMRTRYSDDISSRALYSKTIMAMKNFYYRRNGLFSPIIRQVEVKEQIGTTKQQEQL
jgi:hypothetical protein